MNHSSFMDAEIITDFILSNAVLSAITFSLLHPLLSKLCMQLHKASLLKIIFSQIVSGV